MYSEIKLSGSLRRKFPMPKSRQEQAQAIIGIGIAIMVAGLFDPTLDLSTKLFGESAQAQFIRSAEYRNQGRHNLVGIYAFKAKDGSTYSVFTKEIYNDEAQIPKSVEVAWSLGEPQKAKIIRNFTKNFLTALLGALVLWGGIWFYKSKPKPSPFDTPTEEW